MSLIIYVYLISNDIQGACRLSRCFPFFRYKFCSVGSQLLWNNIAVSAVELARFNFSFYIGTRRVEFKWSRYTITRSSPTGILLFSIQSVCMTPLLPFQSMPLDSLKYSNIPVFDFIASIIINRTSVPGSVIFKYKLLIPFYLFRFFLFFKNKFSSIFPIETNENE